MVSLLVAVQGDIGLNVSVIDKTTTRLPEAMMLRFDPPGVDDMTVSVSKLGEWIASNDTVIDGAQKLHFVDDNGVMFQVTVVQSSRKHPLVEGMTQTELCDEWASLSGCCMWTARGGIDERSNE